jgi:hypothetical protein
MESTRFRSPLDPCYKRKTFQIDGYELSFDFGEYGIGHLDGTSHKYLFVTYVLYHTDKQGNPTSSCSYGGYGSSRVDTLTQGEQLFEAADETGATVFLADHVKAQNYSQTREIIGWLWQWLSRLPLHWRWQLRKRWRSR